MLNKLTRSWELFTSSLQVIRQHKKLLLFPVITATCSVVMLLFFLSPALFFPSGHTLREAAHWESLGRFFGFEFAGEPHFEPNALFYGYSVLIYLVSMFVATFANVAFYHQILQALAGHTVSIREGLRFASGRIPAILMWSLFAGLIGLIIKSLEERLGLIGQWVMRLIGVVWSVASVFAIPVLIREETVNPITMLRNSATTLRKTWGESLIGYVGVAIGSWIILLASLFFLIVAGMLAVVLKSPLLIIGAGALWLFSVLVLNFLVAMASHVYRCALYVYASEGVLPVPYTAEMMNAAWKVKKP